MSPSTATAVCSRVITEKLPGGRFLEGAPPAPPQIFLRLKLWLGLTGLGMGLAGAIVSGLRVAFVFGRMPVCLRQPQHPAKGPVSCERRRAGGSTNQRPPHRVRGGRTLSVTS